jgi:hypothetical protein
MMAAVRDYAKVSGVMPMRLPQQSQISDQPRQPAAPRALVRAVQLCAAECAGSCAADPASSRDARARGASPVC